MIEQCFSRTSVVTKAVSAHWLPTLTTLRLLSSNNAIRQTPSGCFCVLRQLSQWLAQHEKTVTDVDEIVITLYQQPTTAAFGRQPKAALGLPHLLRFLRHHAIVRVPSCAPPVTETERWLSATSSTSNRYAVSLPARGRPISVWPSASSPPVSARVHSIGSPYERRLSRTLSARKPRQSTGAGASYPVLRSALSSAFWCQRRPRHQAWKRWCLPLASGYMTRSPKA